MRFFKWFAAVLALPLFAMQNPAPQTFANKLLDNVRSSIEYNADLQQKEEMFAILDTLGKKGSILEVGSDDLRVKYVSVQGCIEHTLACFQALGEIDELIGVIHTPTPATPLCVKAEGPVDDILDASIRTNSAKLLTVRSRAQIMREYLMKKGTLYAAYPKGGLEKRTVEQQAIYRAALEQYKGNLFDEVLPIDQIDPDMIGATYLFRNKEGQRFAFSIKSRQVNDIQAQTEWGIWFGAVQGEIESRVNAVFDYLADAGGVDPRIKK